MKEEQEGEKEEDKEEEQEQEQEQGEQELSSYVLSPTFSVMGLINILIKFAYYSDSNNG